MPIEQIDIVTNIQTGDANISINQLKENIKIFKDVLNEAEVGSKEYNEALTKTAEAQSELSRINKDLKTATDEVTKSNTTNTNSVKALRDNLKSYRSDLLNLEEGTEEYNTTLLKAADAQRRLREMTENIKFSQQDWDTTLAQVSTGVAGLVGGMNALRGITALLGIDNENLNQTFVQLQAGMSIVQGFQALAGGIEATRDAFVALKATMLSNPLTAVALAIAAITAATVAYISSAKDQNNELEQQIVNQQKLKNLEIDKYISSENEALEYQLRLLSAQGISQKEQLIFRKNELRAIYNKVKAAELEANAIYHTLQMENLRAGRIGALNKEVAAAYEELRKARDNSNEAAKNLNAAIKDYNVLIVSERSGTLESSNSHSSKNENLEKEKNYTIELTDAIQDLIDFDKEVALNRTKETASISELIGLKQEEINVNTELMLIQQEILNSGATDEQKIEAAKELLRLKQEDLTLNQEQFALTQQEEQFKLETEAALSPEELEEGAISPEAQAKLNEMWLLVENEELTLDERKQALDDYNKYYKKASDDKKKIDDIDIKNRKQLNSALISSMQAMSAIVGEETAEGKAIAVAATTIATYQAAQQAYLSAFKPTATVASPFIGAGFAAAAVISGIANVKKILDVKVPGNSTGSAPSSVSAPVPSIPTFSQPIVETHNNMTGYEEEIINKPQKVYIVESEIIDSINKVEIIDTETSF